MPKILFTFEGTDGAGKSPISRKLYEYFLSKDIKTSLITTGFGYIDNAISSLKTDPCYDKKAHFLLALTNSILTYKKNIEYDQCVDELHIYIFDRYYHTTLAYNIALGVDSNWAIETAKVIPRPSKVFFCDASILNILNRKENIDFIETGFSKDIKKKKSFFQFQTKVLECYYKLIAMEPELFCMLDTNDIDKAFEQLLQTKEIINIK